jgi:hypothetical protein
VASVLALHAALWLSLNAVELEAGVRAEARSASIAPVGAPAQTSTSGSITPGAALTAEVGALRADAAYTLRIWSGDVVRSPAGRTLQSGNARFEWRPPSPWGGELTARGLSGRPDPLADPFHPVQAGGPYVVTPAASLPFEWISAGGRGAFETDERTTLEAGAAFSASRGIGAEAESLLPPQHLAWGEVSVAHRASERDTLRLAVTETTAFTLDAAAWRRSSESWAASARWRRRLAPSVDGHAEAGVWTGEDVAASGGSTRQTLPVGELGLSFAATPSGLSWETALRSTTFVEPTTGALVPITEARASLRTLLAERVSVTASGAARRSTDGKYRLGFAELWVRWSLPARVSLEAGLVGRSQSSSRPGIASFSEGAVIGAVAYGTRTP